MMDILKIDNKKHNKFLRRKTSEVDFSSVNKKEIHELVKSMRETMREANGVGLAANQVGLDMKFFVAEFDGKFYAVFNPEIVKKSDEKEILEQSCLSVPDESVGVTRPDKITVKGFDKNGKRIKMNVWGYLSQVFQHEIDHLNGILITDYKK